MPRVDHLAERHEVAAGNDVLDLGMDVRERVDEAVKAYETALRLDPQHLPSLYGLGLAYWQSGRHDESVACIRRLAEYDPQNEQSDLIALDHRQAGLPPADIALLDCSLKLAQRPNDFGREDIELLRESGFSDIQILECIVMTSLTQFLNTLQMGLGTVPDFEPLQVFNIVRCIGQVHQALVNICQIRRHSLL